ncbi:MAG TPA: hypothetical protein VIQ03_13995 [Gammaproteobacteria bacterium]
MTLKSRFIAALLAALFGASALYSGATYAKHCDHNDQEKEDVFLEYSD